MANKRPAICPLTGSSAQYRARFAGRAYAARTEKYRSVFEPLDLRPTRSASLIVSRARFRVTFIGGRAWKKRRRVRHKPTWVLDLRRRAVLEGPVLLASFGRSGANSGPRRAK